MWDREVICIFCPSVRLRMSSIRAKRSQWFGTDKNIPIPIRGVSYTRMSKMDCRECREQNFTKWAGTEDGLKKDRSAGLWRRAVIGFGQQLDPIHEKYGWESTPGWQKDIGLLWVKQHTSADSKELYHGTPYFGKELRTRQEKNSMKF